MTTIAIDQTSIAADGLSVVGDEAIDTDLKKILVRGKRIYAILGSTPLSRAAIEWYENGARPGEQPGAGDNIDWSLIVLQAGQCGTVECVKYSNTIPYPDHYPLPQAFGSGCEYAMGALEAGATPAQAVRIAAKYNVKTGGSIQVVDIASVLGSPLPVAAE